MNIRLIFKTCRRYRALFYQQNQIVIPIKFTHEQDFYGPLDCLGITLSSGISLYLERCLAYLPGAAPITLVFYGPALTGTRQEAVCNLIKTHFACNTAELLRQLLCSLGLLAFTGAAAAFLWCWASLHAITPAVPAAWLLGAVFAGAGVFIALLRVPSQLAKLAMQRRLFSARVQFHPLFAGE